MHPTKKKIPVRRELNSPSFQEPSTPEDQTNYNLSLESNRQSRPMERRQPQKKGKNKRSENIRGRTATLRSDSNSPNSSREINVRGRTATSYSSSPINVNLVKSNVLQPSNVQRASQRNSSSTDDNVFRTPSPKKVQQSNLRRQTPRKEITKQTGRQNRENQSPQPGTSRDFLRETETNRRANVQQAAPKKTAPPNKRKSLKPVKSSIPLLREIYKLQTTTHNLIPKLPFSRLIRELLIGNSISVSRITPTALVALQDCAEMYLVHLLADAYRCTLHRSRVTLKVEDIQLVAYIRSHVAKN